MSSSSLVKLEAMIGTEYRYKKDYQNSPARSKPVARVSSGAVSVAPVPEITGSRDLGFVTESSSAGMQAAVTNGRFAPTIGNNIIT